MPQLQLPLWPMDGGGPGRPGGLILAAVGLILLPGIAGAAPASGTPPPHPAVTYRHHPQTLSLSPMPMSQAAWLDTQLLSTLITSQTRRLEALEGRLGELDARLERRLDKLDTTLERRFDKLAEALSSNEGKEALSREQLARSINTAYERVVYMENNSIKQLKAAAGNILELTTASATMMRTLGSAVSDVKLQLNDSHSHTMNQLLEVYRVVEQQGVKQEDSRGREAGQTYNSTAAAHDVVKTVENAAKGIQNHIDTKSDMMSSKVGNMYNEMWKRVNNLETMIKSAVSISNATWQDVLKLKLWSGFSESQRSLHNRQGSTAASTAHQSGRGSMEVLFESLARVITTDLSRVETGLKETMQSVYDLINGMCEEERIHTEKKISEILNKLMDWVPSKHSIEDSTEELSRQIDSISNKTIRLSKELVEVKRLLKSHNHHVIKGIGNTTLAITNITEGQKQNGKLLQDITDEFSKQISEQKKQVEGLTEIFKSILHNGTTEGLMQNINVLAAAVQNMTQMRDQIVGCNTSPSSMESIDLTEGSDDEAWKAVLQADNESESQTRTPEETFNSSEDISQSLGHVTAIIQRVPQHNDSREIKAIIHAPSSHTEQRNIKATTHDQDNPVLALFQELQQNESANKSLRGFNNALMQDEHSTTESPLLPLEENQNPSSTEHTVTDDSMITTDISIQDDNDYLDDNDEELDLSLS